MALIVSLLELFVVEDGANVEPEVELSLAAEELHLEVTEDFLIVPVQIENQVPLSSAFFVLAGLPLKELLELLGL